MKKIVIKNTLYLTVSNLIVYGLRFIFIIEFAKILGKAELGRYSFALSLATITALFVDLGIDVFLIKEIAADKNNIPKHCTNGLFLKIVLSILNLLVVFFILFFTKDRFMLVVGMFFAASVFIDSIAKVFDAVFVGLQKMWISAVLSISKGVYTFLSCILILKFAPSLYWISLVFFASSAINLAIYFGIFLRDFKLDKSISLKKSFDLAKQGFPFFIAAVCIIIYYQMDTVMLSYLKNDSDVGIYNAAYRLIYFVLLLPNQINRAFFPAMVSIFEKSKEKFIEFYQFGIKIFLVLGIGMATGTMLLAPKVISFLYGKEFSESIVCLQILIWSAALIYVNAFMGITKNSVNLQVLNTRIAIYAVIINMLLNFLLIPRYSYIGAGFATVAAELTSFILHMYFMANLVRIRNISIWVVKVFLINLVMALFIGCILNLNLFVIIVFSGLANILLCFLVRIFSRQEIKHLFSIFKLDKVWFLQSEAF